MGIRIGEDNREAAKAMISQAIACSLEEIGLTADVYAKRKCPVDTGRLRNSITHQVDAGERSGKVHIGTNVEYAAYVELGTYRQREQPFLKPAAADHTSTYKGIVRKHLGG